MNGNFSLITLPENEYSFSFRLWPAFVSFGIALLFMLVATALYWPVPEIAFFSDNSPVSWLSGAQLWAIAFVALRLGAERSLPVAASVWLCAAMVLLAFDEQFMLHERWKYGCIEWLDLCRYRWVTEMPIILIGLVGLGTMIWLHCLLNARSARILLWCSWGIGVLAIVTDLFGWPQSIVKLEEGLEVISESLFAGVLLGIRVHTPNAQ